MSYARPANPALDQLIADCLEIDPSRRPASCEVFVARLNQVIATPHVGGNTRDVAAHQGRIVADELARLIAGQTPRHCLNPEALARFSWSAPRREPPADLLARLDSGPAPAVTDLQRDAAARERKG